MSIEKLGFLPNKPEGGTHMIKREVWYEVHSRFKLKESKKSIARSLGLSVQTVRSVLKQKAPVIYSREQKKETLLAPFEDFIRARLPAVGHCAQAIYEELKDQGYNGCYETVKLFVKPLREDAQSGATMRFETPPGQQAQVDWGQCWTQIAGKRVKIHLFVMTLATAGACLPERPWMKGLPDCCTAMSKHLNISAVQLTRLFMTMPKRSYFPVMLMAERFSGIRPSGTSAPITVSRRGHTDHIVPKPRERLNPGNKIRVFFDCSKTV